MRKIICSIGMFASFGAHGMTTLINNTNIGVIEIELNRQEDLCTFNIDIKTTDLLNATDTKTFSSVIRTDYGREFIDFGYGLNFSLLNGSINLESAFCNSCDYFKTNTDVLISDVYIKKCFSIIANKIIVKGRFSCDSNLTLQAISISTNE